uniref:ADP,ATP carrier protein n=1 Tax=Helicotheca tamesis TaxID=374047 RepID=A0A7S2DY88_9STRA|mmetsp:Transcript_108/g.115  ORF Transcript_108/g.115 Transcript_108/m.115 type:complete len:336 (+) Transcript_108:159-1166(+)|eukprot:CAMPEP_0185734590 /NCGR_PEP_ID=MMETSP1171-20130828/22962_1 /TAXON_ID=374046 /ORGANISM="Helicotheca tamensis, Strain CCMP826" /LENGTH=335 /DNA_ID=CAMNT_0028404623 /DNA_START=84 /DNA_END=1091 /DNA_ORIENTATION=-
MANESIATEVISASLGGAFSASALYPLEVLKTKMQAETSDSSKTNATENGDEEKGEQEQASLGMIAYSQKMYAENGIGAFYSGIGTSAFQSAMEKALYFFAYTALKNVYKTMAILTGSDDGRIGTFANLVLGSMAEWAHLPITLPIDCLTTKIQTDSSGKGAFALLSAMLSEKGIAGMYKGIQAYTVLCLKPAIQYTVFEQVKRVVLLGRRNADGRTDYSLGAAEAFLLGMVARLAATIAVFPYLRAKVMLQSTYADVEDGSNTGGTKKKKGIPSMIAEMYASGGVAEMFRGIGPELTRGVLSAALMLMAKEKISAAVRATVEGDDRRSRMQERR